MSSTSRPSSGNNAGSGGGGEIGGGGGSGGGIRGFFSIFRKPSDQANGSQQAESVPSKLMSDSPPPSQRDVDNPPEETGSSEPKTKTPPPLPSSNPVVKETVPAEDLMQFVNEEEKAATVEDPSSGQSPMDTTEPPVTTELNPKMKAALEAFQSKLPQDFENEIKYLYHHETTIDPCSNEDQLKFQCALTPHNQRKNRTASVLPYSFNRFKFKSVHGEFKYLNASHIDVPGGKTKFIAAQAPLPVTLEEWWSMIDDAGITVIVMACKLMEGQKSKCERYWPEVVDQPEMFGEYDVNVEKEQKFADEDYLLRTMTMECLRTGETRRLYQLHYQEWPDHGCPTGVKQLLNMMDVMDKLKEQYSKDKPILVHCSAGVGRTGTIIALNHIREQMRAGTLENIDIFELVVELRRQRMCMVQTQDQYTYVHRCIATLCRRYLRIPETLRDEMRYQPSHLSSGVQTPVLIAPPTPTTGDVSQQPGTSGTQDVIGKYLEEHGGDSNLDEDDTTPVPDFPNEPPEPADRSLSIIVTIMDEDNEISDENRARWWKTLAIFAFFVLVAGILCYNFQIVCYIFITLKSMGLEEILYKIWIWVMAQTFYAVPRLLFADTIQKIMMFEPGKFVVGLLFVASLIWNYRRM